MEIPLVNNNDVNRNDYYGKEKMNGSTATCLFCTLMASIWPICAIVCSSNSDTAKAEVCKESSLIVMGVVSAVGLVAVVCSIAYCILSRNPGYRSI